MTDRQRAQDILRQAREILASRLSELVLDQSEEILADARGESYMNEIESLYEQVGMKLAHISQILSHLPAEPIEPVTTTAAAPHSPEHTFSMATDTGQRADASVEDALPAIGGPVYVVAPALPPAARWGLCLNSTSRGRLHVLRSSPSGSVPKRASSAA